MAAIELRDVHKRYGSVVALDGLSLSVDEGALFGVLGPNGAGKTTMLEVLTGQVTPEAGRATVLGVDPVADPVGVRTRVGILPERESPPSFLTPREYFAFVGTVRGLSMATVDDAVEAMADRFDFAGVLDTLSTDLSRGQQQKVMLAAAFLHDPAAVLIDEPLTNLDPLVQERVKALLRERHDEGTTIVLSTHNVEVAADLCSHVAIVNDGRLLAEVRPADLGDRSLLEVYIDRVSGGHGS
ncbi:MAG: ABC transporter ATP-binding protein [Halobacteriales archaeon]